MEEILYGQFNEGPHRYSNRKKRKVCIECVMREEFGTIPVWTFLPVCLFSVQA